MSRTAMSQTHGNDKTFPWSAARFAVCRKCQLPASWWLQTGTAALQKDPVARSTSLPPRSAVYDKHTQLPGCWFVSTRAPTHPIPAFPVVSVFSSSPVARVGSVLKCAVLTGWKAGYPRKCSAWISKQTMWTVWLWSKEMAIRKDAQQPCQQTLLLPPSSPPLLFIFTPFPCYYGPHWNFLFNFWKKNSKSMSVRETISSGHFFY